MTLEEIFRILRAELPRLRSEFKVANLQAFGSYVRKEETPGSDTKFKGGSEPHEPTARIV